MDWTGLLRTTEHPSTLLAGRSAERRTLLMAAAKLEALWRSRIDHARGRCGLHAFLCTASPRYLPAVKALRLRQQALLDDLARLRVAAQSSSLHCTWLHAEFGRLAREVVIQDELETEILCDALERP